MYIPIQSILTKIPKAIRSQTSREELLSYLLEGYRQLIVGFDQETQKVIEEFSVKNHKVKLPERIKRIRGIITKEFSEPVYYHGLTKSNICPTCQTCMTCEKTFSVENRMVTLSFKEDDICIMYETEILQDGFIQVYDDPAVRDYLRYYAVYESLLNRSLSGDQISNTMYQDIKTSMNVTYAKAQGAIILRNKQLERLDRDILNYNIDEFSYRHYFN